MNWKNFWTAAIAGGLTLVAILILCAVVLFALIGTIKVGWWVAFVFLVTLWVGTGKIYYDGMDKRERTKTSN